MAVPFTTPVIAQSRCRPTPYGKVELIVPNPSGADGAYVFPLTSVGAFCTPTIHDQFVLDALENVDIVAPATIRHLAAEAARLGYAGRLAANAAKDRAEDYENNQMLSYMALFVEVLRTAGFGDIDWRTFDVDNRNMRARAKACIGDYAPKFNKTGEDFMVELEKLSQAVSYVGIGAHGLTTPADVQTDLLRQFIASLSDWNRGGQEAGKLTGLIIDAANLTLEKVQQSITNCHKITGSMPNLLRVWFNQRKKMAQAFCLADWMLDGWPYICSLWHSVEDHDRFTKFQVMERIGELVPLMPTEVDQWLGGDSRYSTLQELRDRRVRINEDWRSGTMVVNSVEHNEQLRAFV